MNESITARPIAKYATGIEGLDDISNGGLPRGGTTLLMGGPGSGKTVLALQILANNATQHGIAGIFVAFEENPARLQANAITFEWRIPTPESNRLAFVDACVSPKVVKAGAFDLTGLLAILESKALQMGTKLIVFDAIDVLLNLLDDSAAECRELYRVHEWLMRNDLTGILTSKVDNNNSANAHRFGYMPFMADCAVMLSYQVTDRVAVRMVRILKYRGSAHVLNEVPFVIGPAGFEVGSSNGAHPEPQPFNERISTGIPRLDEMLAGGIYRGTNALITGASGTGKSMLAGKLIEAAGARGERGVYISFDENSKDIVRDLGTIRIDLQPHIKSGLLRMEAFRSESASSEEHFMRIKRTIKEHKPCFLVVDPISALARVGGGIAARGVAERLIYLCRNEGITVLFTSLPEGIDDHLETTPLHVSTISDTWLQITYSLLNGERNRAITIIKSRGTKHSNQLRELIFNDEGITLADPYTAGGKVLLGTMRQEKEMAVSTKEKRKEKKQHTVRTEVPAESEAPVFESEPSPPPEEIIPPAEEAEYTPPASLPQARKSGPMQSGSRPSQQPGESYE